MDHSVIHAGKRLSSKAPVYYLPFYHLSVSYSRFSGGALRTITCYNRQQRDTDPGSGCDRHSTDPLGAGIIWTRMANSSSVSSSNHAAGAGVSSRRYIASSPPVPSSTRRACHRARPPAISRSLAVRSALFQQRRRRSPMFL